MTNAKETKRLKAADMRYKKPIARGLNLDDITRCLHVISGSPQKSLGGSCKDWIKDRFLKTE